MTSLGLTKDTCLPSECGFIIKFTSRHLSVSEGGKGVQEVLAAGVNYANPVSHVRSATSVSSKTLHSIAF